MTELHWALIVVAGVLLLALWVYGKWQERRDAGRGSKPPCVTGSAIRCRRRRGPLPERRAAPCVESSRDSTCSPQGSRSPPLRIGEAGAETAADAAVGDEL